MTSEPSNQPDHQFAAAFAAVLTAVTNFLGNPVLGVVVRHRIPDHLENGALTAEDLGGRAGLHPLSIARALRFLASLGLFEGSALAPSADTSS